MITNDLFNKVLVEPVKNGADRLYIVSGYATASMTFHHFETIKKIYKKQIQIDLIVGMCPSDGLSLGNHKAFQQLVTVDFPDSFKCSYIFNSPPVHSKAYTWFQGKKPIGGFAGSANYTQNAFSNAQRELLIPCDPILGFEYFQSLTSDSIYCTHNEIENNIGIYHDTYYGRRRKESLEKKGLQLIVSERPEMQDLPAVRISLLDRKGNVQQTAGLNWGFRQDGISNRNKNEAYIQLRPEIYKSDFFPIRSMHFTVLTDDGKTLICTRAQKDKYGHAIETPHNNSLIGEYFRNRLGLRNGAFVTKDNLLKYGRTDVVFYKIDDETYFMDFSVSARLG